MGAGDIVLTDAGNILRVIDTDSGRVTFRRIGCVVDGRRRYLGNPESDWWGVCSWPVECFRQCQVISTGLILAGGSALIGHGTRDNNRKGRNNERNLPRARHA